MTSHPFLDALPESFTARYTPLEVLGSGGQGLAVLARHNELRRDVVVKFLMRLEPVAERRFHLEGGLLSRISHPNVIRIYDLGQVSDLLYLVMEYVPGETLAAHIQRGSLTPAGVMAVADDILAALGVVHELGIIHRDLKPENVWVGADGTCRLLDFGIARQDAGEGLTRPGALMGTPAYAPPEQILGEAQDGRCDLYSFGILLHEMITGVNPFDSDSAVLTLERQLGLRVETMSRPRFRVPPILENLVLSLMQKNPENRPASAAEARAILRHAAAVPPRGRVRSTLKGNRPTAPAMRVPGGSGSFASFLPERRRTGLTATGGRRRDRSLLLAATFLVSLLVGLAGGGFVPGARGPAPAEEAAALLRVPPASASPALPSFSLTQRDEILALVEKSRITRREAVALRLSGDATDPFRWDSFVEADRHFQRSMISESSSIEGALDDLEGRAHATDERGLRAILHGSRLCLRTALDGALQGTSTGQGRDLVTASESRDIQSLDRARRYFTSVGALVAGLGPASGPPPELPVLVALTAEAAGWIDLFPWRPDTAGERDRAIEAFEAALLAPPGASELRRVAGDVLYLSWLRGRRGAGATDVASEIQESLERAVSALPVADPRSQAVKEITSRVVASLRGAPRREPGAAD